MENGNNKQQLSCAVSVLYSHLSCIFFFKAENAEIEKEMKEALTKAIEPLEQSIKIKRDGSYVKCVISESQEYAEKILELSKELCIKHSWSFTPYPWGGFDDVGDDECLPGIDFEQYAHIII